MEDDLSLRRAVWLCKQAGCQVLVCIQPTISDGRLAPVLGQVLLHLLHPALYPAVPAALGARAGPVGLAGGTDWPDDIWKLAGGFL